ncbi:MAG: ATP-dependent helicase [Lachnospiraceae bacterium]|nr:ATP-dependent helicase [Lachnospiraceae bacterium]
MTQFNREQEMAVLHGSGPMLVLAGPGSGKTAVLTGRLCRLVREKIAAPERILVLTFSKEAAEEMQQRFKRELGGIPCPVHFGTFHAVFYHILRKQGLYHENSILDTRTKKEYIRFVGKKLQIAGYYDQNWQEEMLQRISAQKNGKSPDFDEEKDREAFERIFTEYSEKCRKERRLDFDDMITECIRLLTEIPKVLKKWQDRFDYFLVDEFQDIDKKQYEVLRLLAGEKKNIFAVGDDDQSIYGFRGAAPGIMQRFKEDYAGIKVVNLKSNYRSRREIVDNAIHLIKNNSERLPKEQRAEKGDGGFIELRVFNSGLKEALFVAERIRALRIEKPGMSIGVLYRTGKAPELLENELKRQGMAFYRNEKRRNFYEEEWVKDVLSYLRLSAGRGDLKDILRILNRPDRGLSREAFNSLRIGAFSGDICGREPCGILAPLYEYYCDDEEKLCAVKGLEKGLLFIKGLPVRGAVNYVLKGFLYEKELKKRSRGNEDDAMELEAELFDSLGGAVYTEEFLDHVDSANEAFSEQEEKASKGRTDPAGNTVLQTVHASKGLEYDAVFVIGLQEGMFPHKKAVTRAETEEERRLFYVAMTRARERLYICGLKKDDFGKKESRFLHELLIKPTDVG